MLYHSTRKSILSRCWER